MCVCDKNASLILCFKRGTRPLESVYTTNLIFPCVVIFHKCLLCAFDTHTHTLLQKKELLVVKRYIYHIQSHLPPPPPRL
mmetsp:Transcript_22102/g.29142  ORF Transcript_22102/g.29142 Transcript_22102/m.29142 type:complete len:80 (-) Transcript_22102:386-625(-)